MGNNIFINVKIGMCFKIITAFFLANCRKNQDHHLKEKISDNHT